MLAAMIVCGAILTALSFTMQLGTASVKSQLQGLMSQAGSLVSGSVTKSR